MKVLYFAWVRSTIGVDREELDPPATVTDVAGLIDWLRARGGGYAEAFKDTGVVRAAVNQQHVAMDHPVKAGDEIALFPPVTGG
ncbi:MAG: molybdopterin converting factor subunit 1 [Magnetospiraceae bacterium]